MNAHKTVAILFIASIFLGACAPGGVDENTLRTQVALENTLTALASGGQAAPTNTTAPGVPSETPFPSDTPTITLTPTSEIPMVSVTNDTNCRTGPSQHYGLVTLVKTGQQAEVVAVYPSSNYVVIRNPNGSGLCWLWLQYATQTDFSAFNLPVATQPPTPTATFTSTPSIVWEGAWNTDAGGPGTMTLFRSGNSISGTFDFGGGITGSVAGTLSADLRTVTGTYDVGDDGTSDGNFVWQIKLNNLNQWVGNYGGGAAAWCGWRSGSSAPSPCLGP